MRTSRMNRKYPSGIRCVTVSVFKFGKWSSRKQQLNNFIFFYCIELNWIVVWQVLCESVFHLPVTRLPPNSSWPLTSGGEATGDQPRSATFARQRDFPRCSREQCWYPPSEPDVAFFFIYRGGQAGSCPRWGTKNSRTLVAVCSFTYGNQLRAWLWFAARRLLFYFLSNYIYGSFVSDVWIPGTNV